MRTLHLPLKAKWYDMIEAGIKKEEYRDIKPYWRTRLLPNLYPKIKQLPEYKVVCFRYGYTKRTITFKIDDVDEGRGNSEWGAPDRDVYIIRIGERIN